MVVQAEDEDMDTVPVGTSGSSIIQDQIVYQDTNPGAQLDHAVGQSSFEIDSATRNTDLSRFLARPTVINTRTWSTTDVVGSLGVLYPWEQLLTNNVIKRKLENYAYLRAKLHLKFIINGTQFHYGMLRACYETLYDAYPSRIRSNVTSNLPLRVPKSQLMGIDITPTTNEGGDLTIPMIWNREWLPLQVAVDARALGRLDYFVYYPLSIAASGVTSTVTVTTYAWLEDVEVSGSTARLVMQAGDEYDSVGVISAPAAKISSLARSLSNVPVIGKFAKATEIGATAVGAIAKMFGFSNTPNIKDVEPLLPMAIPHLATAEISIPYQKLSLNPKQELSIDSTALHGTEVGDPLEIQSFIKRRSFFGATSWATSDIPGEILFNMAVTPTLNDLVELNDIALVARGARVYHTPLSFAASMFDGWRGDIILTIKVIKSRFHKGRIKVTWDPKGTGSITVPDSNEVYNVIIDLGEQDEYKIKIPYHSDVAYLNCRSQSDTNIWNPGNPLSVAPLADNGQVTVSVLTELGAPLTTADVGLLFYIEAGDNFHFQNPRDDFGNAQFYNLQSQDESIADFGESAVVPSHLGVKYYGEVIASFRTLLRRNALLDILQCPDSTANQMVLWQKTFPYFPLTPGWNPNGADSANKQLTAGTAPYSFVAPMHPLPYIVSCFAGFSGSMNYNFNFSGGLDNDNDTVLYRGTGSAPSSQYLGNGIVTGIDTTVSSSSRHRTMTTNTGYMGGVASLSRHTNSGLAVTVPFMDNFSFAFPNPTGAANGSSPPVVDGTTRHFLTLRSLLTQTSSNGAVRSTRVNVYLGAGVDFNVVQFVCVPTFDYPYNIPSAV